MSAVELELLREADRRLEVEQPGDRGAVRQQLIRQLAEPRPYDLDQIRLAEYRSLAPRWTDWSTVLSTCADASEAMLEAVAKALPGWDDLG